MTPERYKIIGRLFDEALELAPDQRAAWLDQVCRADSGLRQDVKTLLGSQKRGPSVSISSGHGYRRGVF